VVGEQGWPLEPLQIAMRLGKGVDAWLTALRFKQLAPLQISGYEKKSDNGRSFDEVHFRADNGRLDADFDSITHFLSRVSFEAHPFGAPEDVFIKISGECAPKVLANAQGLVAFDPNGKVAVADLARLDAAQLPTGKLAPSIELKNLAGERVSFRRFQGSVVVLDFWASWCAPCWKTLLESQHLSNWASQSGLRVMVLPIDTMEQFATEEETRIKATEFFRSQQSYHVISSRSEGRNVSGVWHAWSAQHGREEIQRRHKPKLKKKTVHIRVPLGVNDANPRQLLSCSQTLRATSAVEAGLAGTREVGFRRSATIPNLLLVVDYELPGRRLHRCHSSCLTARSIRTSSGRRWPVTG
jgi:thiol-disulfide isomerase/thioredoxin